MVTAQVQRLPEEQFDRGANIASQKRALRYLYTFCQYPAHFHMKRSAFSCRSADSESAPGAPAALMFPLPSALMVHFDQRKGSGSIDVWPPDLYRACNVTNTPDVSTRLGVSLDCSVPEPTRCL